MGHGKNCYMLLVCTHLKFGVAAEEDVLVLGWLRGRMIASGRCQHFGRNLVQLKRVVTESCQGARYSMTCFLSAYSLWGILAATRN